MKQRNLSNLQPKKICFGKKNKNCLEKKWLKGVEGVQWNGSQGTLERHESVLQEK